MKKLLYACAALLGFAACYGEKKPNTYPAVFWSPSGATAFKET